MTELSWVVVFLGLISFCSLTLTLILITTAWDLRRLFQKLLSILPHCDQTLCEARETLHLGRQLLERANKATAQAEVTFIRIYDFVGGILEPLFLVRQKVQSFWEQQFGNGSRKHNRRYNRKK